MPTTLPRFSLAQLVNSSFRTSTPFSAKTFLCLFLQHLILTTSQLKNYCPIQPSISIQNPWQVPLYIWSRKTVISEASRALGVQQLLPLLKTFFFPELLPAFGHQASLEKGIAYPATSAQHLHERQRKPQQDELPSHRTLPEIRQTETCKHWQQWKRKTKQKPPTHKGEELIKVKNSSR